MTPNKGLRQPRGPFKDMPTSYSYGGWCKTCITLRTLDCGNYVIFLIMGNAGFISSTVSNVDSGYKYQAAIIIIILNT